jgi:hypothetical protein
MATFYKYAERNAQSQINWAEVGRNITDTLREEARIREEKIATIDENTRQMGITIENNPQGEHEGLNQWSLDYASSAQEMRLIQDRLLRSGQLNLRDYTKMRQNLSDGTDGIFSALEEYQTEYTDKMERMRKGDSQPLETWLMAQAEGLSNFKNHKPVIDPMTSQVYVGKIENGELVEDPNTYVSVSALRNRIKGKFDMFKADDYAEKVASGFGIETLEVAKKIGTTWGKITSMEGTRGTVNLKDQAAIDAYKIAEKAAIDSAFANPYNLTSLLSVQSNYTFTWDPKAAASNANLILLKNDPQTGYPVPDFDTAHGPKQKEAATELLKNIIRSKMDKKTEEKTFGIAQVTPRTPTQPKQGETTAQTNASMIGRLYTGGQDLQTALDYFRGRLPAGTQIKRSPQGITIINQDGTSEEIKFTNTDGSQRRQDQFIEAASSVLLKGEKDESANVIGLVKRGGYSKGVLDATSQGSAIVQKPKTNMDRFKEKVDRVSSGLKNAETGAFLSEENAKESLNREFAGSGFEFDWRYDNNEAIEVKSPDGKVQKFELNDVGVQAMRTFIKAEMTNSVAGKKPNVGYLNTLEQEPLNYEGL